MNNVNEEEGSREVYDVWHLGEPVDELLIQETLRSYGIIIPGHNTLKLLTLEQLKVSQNVVMVVAI